MARTFDVWLSGSLSEKALHNAAEHVALLGGILAPPSPKRWPCVGAWP